MFWDGLVSLVTEAPQMSTHPTCCHCGGDPFRHHEDLGHLRYAGAVDIWCRRCNQPITIRAETVYHCTPRKVADE
jgi:hypothetical protein